MKKIKQINTKNVDLHSIKYHTALNKEVENFPSCRINNFFQTIIHYSLSIDHVLRPTFETRENYLKIPLTTYCAFRGHMSINQK